MTTGFARHQTQIPSRRRPKQRLPLLRAVCEHSVGLVIGQRAPARFGTPTSSAFVVVVEDRDPNMGPRAFDVASLLAVLREVHGVVVLTGESLAEPYTRTASLLAQGVSTLIVETKDAHGQAWRNLVVTVAPDLPVVVL